MLGPNPRGLGAYARTAAPPPRLPETPVFDKIRNYRLRPLGQETYQATLEELRHQLRSAELRPDVFNRLQKAYKDLLASEMSVTMEPIARARELVQGAMTAFVEKKMDHAEAARVILISVVFFFPRGAVEQLDVAQAVATELMLTKINLNTEMVQMAYGMGRGYPLMVGLAYFAPRFMNKEQDYLQALYKKIHEGIWTGSMLATYNSQPHGQTNVEKYELGCEQFIQEWVAKLAAQKTSSLLSKLPFGWKS